MQFNYIIKPILSVQVHTLPNVEMSADKSKLTISKVAAKDVGTYR